jgi:sulfate transport system permease protein
VRAEAAAGWFGAPARSVAAHARCRRTVLRATAVGYLTLAVVLPLAAVVHDGLAGGMAGFVQDVTTPMAWSALRLTLWTAALMTGINAVMGTLTAFALVRYEFPGRSAVNALVDVPFAIPTLVTGVMLVILYGPQGTLGGWLHREWGIDVIFAPPGIVLALLFVSLPFVTRSVQPVLMTLDRDQEEAAATLGSGPWRTFTKVLLPTLAPSIATGSLLAFARALGEFGSIVIVAGNFPFRSQTAPVYVLTQIESDQQHAASAVSIVLLAIAFTLMIAVDLAQRRSGAGNA